MFIKKIQLQNFKRFSDLTIDLSEYKLPPKLVLLIGANGSGKSSIFDAFNLIINLQTKGLPKNDFNVEYYYKKQESDFFININFTNEEKLKLKNFNIEPNKDYTKTFYGRSSLRIVPVLLNATFQESLFTENKDSPLRLIDYDNRFTYDVGKYVRSINQSLLSPVFKGEAADTVKIFQSFIEPFNNSLLKIFGEDSKTSIQIAQYEVPTVPNESPKLIFEKGDSLINYDLLSHGEKQVVTTLLNFVVRREYFQNTIYYIDEMDSHMNTTIQKALLKEVIEKWIPEGCQLWTASHALGFIDYANESDHAAIIDLDNLDFDQDHTITPSEKNNFDVFEIAVNQEFLSKLFEGKKIVFAENTDTPYYNNLNIKDTIFFVGKDKQDVFFKTINGDYHGLVDRDYLSDEELDEIKSAYPNLKILNYYSIENYLYHPDNLELHYLEINKPFDKEKYIQDLRDEKMKMLNKIFIGIAKGRDSYPFFRDDAKRGKRLKQFQGNAEAIIPLLESDDFEVFYKVFPMKDYAKQLPQRQNLNKSNLASTAWFKSAIQDCF